MLTSGTSEPSEPTPELFGCSLSCPDGDGREALQGPETAWSRATESPTNDDKKLRPLHVVVKANHTAQLSHSSEFDRRCRRRAGFHRLSSSERVRQRRHLFKGDGPSMRCLRGSGSTPRRLCFGRCRPPTCAPFRSFDSGVGQGPAFNSVVSPVSVWFQRRSDEIAQRHSAAQRPAR